MRGDLVNEKVTPQSSPPLSGKLAIPGKATNSWAYTEKNY